ncbi:MAG: hypothetical protein ABW000_15935 [Actinoplanes sp.]
MVAPAHEGLSLGTWRRDPGTVIRQAGSVPPDDPAPLLESLLVRLARKDLDAETRARTEAVVFDVLVPSERQFAPELPGDPRIDPIAEALLADPSDDHGLLQWAAHLGLTDRTITRAFRGATG